MTTSEPDPSGAESPEAESPEAESPEAESPEAAVRYGRRRRAPRYGSFVATGAILGIALGIALAVVQAMRSHDSGQFSGNTVLGYVAATLGLVGALVGAAVAVILDRRRP